MDKVAHFFTTELVTFLFHSLHCYMAFSLKIGDAVNMMPIVAQCKLASQWRWRIRLIAAALFPSGAVPPLLCRTLCPHLCLLYVGRMNLFPPPLVGLLSKHQPASQSLCSRPSVHFAGHCGALPFSKVLSSGYQLKKKNKKKIWIKRLPGLWNEVKWIIAGLL